MTSQHLGRRSIPRAPPSSGLPSLPPSPLVSTRRRQTQVHLETVVDEPLESRKSTDHDNAHGQAVPQARESNVAVDAGHGGSGALAGLAVTVELRDHDVCFAFALALTVRV